MFCNEPFFCKISPDIEFRLTEKRHPLRLFELSKQKKIRGSFVYYFYDIKVIRQIGEY
jgi:hypothetical protein